MVGPTIFRATTTACGYVPGQLTTNDACVLDACQDRPTDDRSTTNAPCQGETIAFVSSTAVQHPPGNCPGGYQLVNGQCCICAFQCTNCQPRPPAFTSYDVCFNCRTSFTELGKLVK